MGDGLGDPGYIAAYPPGVRENGGQYNHAAAWLGLAFAALGDGDRAWSVLQRILPFERSSTRRDALVYRVEPYVVSGDVYTEAPLVGRGGWTWYTGSASWTWRLGVEGILGIRRVRGAVAVAPAIPRAWPGFSATLRGPGGVLEIVVDNAARTGRGVVATTLDGVPVPPDVPVAFPTDGGTHRLEVVLGRVTSAIVAESSAIP